MGRTLRRAARWTAPALIAAAIGIQFVRPPRTNPTTDPARTLAVHAAVTSDAAEVLDRACRDCHSNETRWPWYSTVAPVSWFVIDHVNHGRRHFNYSNWAAYEPGEARRLLTNACVLARKDDMPLPAYTRMHAAARLSDRDIAALCDWTDGVLRQARRTLNPEP
jgi:heme-binding protein